MTRRLSLPLLFLLLIVTPILPGWMAVAHEAAQPLPVQGEHPADHLAHTNPQSALQSHGECAMQMDGACVQLCAFSAVLSNLALPALTGARGYNAGAVPAPDTPYLAPPFQPPKA
ncbi:hypothetical protein [Halopseudomonas laoshanensis]|nr:hypothetical protein [Halopseudomonas laoshanensis]